MTWWKGLIAAVLVLGSGAIAVAGLKDKPPPAVEVQVGAAKKAAITRTVTGAGKVQAATTVKISSSLSGDLMELNVKAGEAVTRGQVLGKIDRRRFEAAVKQATAAVSAARADTKAAQVNADRVAAEVVRVAGLVEKGLASKAEVEKVTADRDAALAQVAALNDRASQAMARLEEASSDLAKTTLFSPIDGTVIELSREVGERVRGSDFSEDVVMTIAALATMEVKIEVGEHEVVHLKVGQKSEVRVDALEGQSFEGTVVEIAQKALIRNQGSEAETTSFPVTVALTARPPGVLPGMSSEVKIVAESRESALVVPVQAVTVRPAKMLKDLPADIEGKKLEAPKTTEAFAKVVFVVDGENKTHVRRVRTGISSDTDVEVLEGLAEGDRVVEGPYRTLAKELKDGDRVEEVKPGEKKGGFGKGKG
ncbi:MAG: efflux RND transporter periplasmic adaptor subunit [Myxococcaceae bacterium]|nr:efflux RND transporter periplasmic adaptor subunit [Myxococcaceae bacterium]